MKFEEITKLLNSELSQVRLSLKNIKADLPSSSANEIFEYFFNNQGKLLRPILVMLSAGTINKTKYQEENKNLINLSVAIELIHNASLLHDDVVDSDFHRRGQPTVNNVYGNKIAAWTGDVLYTHGFSILSTEFPKEFPIYMAEVTRKMSMVETRQAADGNFAPTYEKYLELIKGKTALIMGGSCKLGAILVGATKIQAEAMETFGINLGMVYQIIDDLVDDDPLGIGNASLEDAVAFAELARNSIKDFNDSEYSKSLISLLNLVLNQKNKK